MTASDNHDSIINLPSMSDLPDIDGARRFLKQLAENHPSDHRKLQKKNSLLSDVLAIAAFSPLLATTLLQNPSYIFWLEKQRGENVVRMKEELLESLARFSLTNSQIEPQILLSRFRRRELLRIYLRDIRRLETITETTEEISNLADAILEYALQIARQEIDNRCGIPLEIDDKGREKPATFCIVSLGKLGSRELNYASDIDLLFVYSGEGATSGKGTCGEPVTNREYFIKLAELTTKIVGKPAGEGAAYRVDLRLRPHGRVGSLAVSLEEAVRYYQNQAQPWERQTLIRARASAGDAKIFRQFWKRLEPCVYSVSETVENALHNVKLSKDKINSEHAATGGYNVKLGKGGIREIEFLAQALQLAYGGADKWLRSPHTLISLSRLADRKLFSETELTKLFDAYEFLRRLEHRLQMEHGLQTHLVPDNRKKKSLVARRMNFPNADNFETALRFHTQNVSRVFERIFGSVSENLLPDKTQISFVEKPSSAHSLSQILTSIDKSRFGKKIASGKLDALAKISQTSPHFAEMISASPGLIEVLPTQNENPAPQNYDQIFSTEISAEPDFRSALAKLRTVWTKYFLRIAAFDIYEKLDLQQTKKLQTELAEASIKAALKISEIEMSRKFKSELQITNYKLQINSDEVERKIGELQLAVLGLGKLGGRGMDFGSDLDLVLIYDDERPLPVNLSHAEFYSRAADIFVTALSSFTREGNLYRVDLRLRPDGKNGATSIGKTAFLSYLENRAAIWEWLAYVKLRGIETGTNFAVEIEKNARRIVHEKSQKADKTVLKTETVRIRERLARKKNRAAGTDIKYDSGGLLDVYFAARFLQLRDDLPDDSDNRSTQFTLQKLYENKSLSEKQFNAFSAGHRFLSTLDHNLRLTVGRSNFLPLANKPLLQIIADRMKLESIADLFEKLALHRIEIHTAFEEILKS